MQAITAISKPEEPDTSQWAHHTGWKWSTNAGPAFARLNGDVNPIHWSPRLAKLFGFRSNIAHGQHVIARAVNAIEQQGETAPSDFCDLVGFINQMIIWKHCRCPLPCSPGASCIVRRPGACKRIRDVCSLAIIMS